MQHGDGSGLLLCNLQCSYGGEAYVGLVYWTGLVEFMRNIYWFQLAKGGMSFEVGFVAYLFTPALVIAHPILRARLQGHIWSRPLLLLCGLVGIGGQFFWGPLMRLAFAATSVGILGIYVIDGLWAASRARRRQVAFGMVGGIMLLQVEFLIPGRVLLLVVQSMMFHIQHPNLESN